MALNIYIYIYVYIRYEYIYIYIKKIIKWVKIKICIISEIPWLPLKSTFVCANGALINVDMEDANLRWLDAIGVKLRWLNAPGT